jgi:RHS repeat-associated protein
MTSAYGRVKLKKLLHKGAAVLLLFVFIYPIVTNAQEASGGTAPSSTDTSTLVAPAATSNPAPSPATTESSAPSTNSSAAPVKSTNTAATSITAAPASMVGVSDAASAAASAAQVRKLPDVDEQSGALTFSYPLTVPPGRSKLGPKLDLQYTTRAATDVTSAFGAGWSVNIPYIVRLNKTGVDNLYSSYYFYSSLSGDLATTSNATSTTAYDAKSDDGSFINYSFSNNQWTATDKNGVTYDFGYSSTTRQDNPGNAAQAYKWMLEKVIDPNGNYTTYQYFKDNGQIYPQAILYTADATSTSGVFRVDFTHTARTDVATTTNTGFTVVTNYVITQVQAKSNGAVVHSYTLGYTTGDDGFKSLLKTITESGFDESGATTTLPAMQFTYGVATPAFAQDTGYSIPVLFQSGITNQGVRTADVNGDGYPDIIQSIYNGADTRAVYLNKHDGTGWALASSTPPVYFLNGSADQGVVMADVNGDGYVDMIQSFYSGVNIQGVYINNGDGTGWTLNNNYSIPVYFNNGGANQGVRVADVNGDGYPDLIQSMYNGSNVQGVYLNKRDGTGWASAPSWSIPVYFKNGGDQGVRLVDVNGDGLLDLVQSFYDSSNHQAVYLNKGDGTGWALDTSWTIPEYFQIQGADNGVRFADVNGDGLLDLIKSNGSGSAVYLNTGHSFALNANYTVPNQFINGTTDQGVIMDDVNADGAVDYIQSDYSGVTTQRVFRNYSHAVDLLKNVTYAAGGTTTIAYATPANLKDNSGNLLNPVLPENTQVTNALSTTDGLGNSATTTLSYKDSYFYYGNPLDRRYAGYGSIKKTDALGNTLTTFYHQGNTTSTTTGKYNDNGAKIGRVYRTEVRDPSNNLLQKSINQWDSATRVGDANFVKLIRTTQSAYAPNGSHKDKSTTSAYDNTNGNLLQSVNWGEVTGADDGSFSDVGSDQLTTSYLYASSSGSTVTGLVSQASTTDQSANKIKESRYYYDTLGLGSVSLGNLTKQEDWLATSTYAATQHAYNSYGLVTQDTDPRGKITTYTYDPNNLYVATTTNPLAQTTYATYNYPSGQVDTYTDVAGNTFTSVYDGLGRQVSELQPDLQAATSSVQKSSTTYTDTVLPMMTHIDNIDTGTTTTSYTYLDGLNRKIQVRTQTENPNVYIVRDTAYDMRGQVSGESLPYFSTGASSTPAIGAPKLWKSYAYDALNRPTAFATTEGTTTYAYTSWETTVTDPLSNSKDLFRDANGNLATVREYNNGATATTTYAWDGLKDLTKITDATSNIRNFTYDGLGRLLTAEDLHAAGDTTFGTTTYGYDTNSNLTTKTDPKLQTVNYTYDDLNRPLTEDYTGQGGTEVTYSYDGCSNGKGLLCAATTSGNVSSNYTYNRLGLVKDETKTIASTNYTTSYGYNRQGTISTVVYPDGSQANYTFNAGGQLEAVSYQTSSTSAATPIVQNFNYDANNDVVYQLYGNSVETFNNYDQNNLYRLTHRRTVGPQGRSSYMMAGRFTLAALNGTSSLSKTKTLALSASSAPVPTPIVQGNAKTVLVGVDSKGAKHYLTDFYQGSAGDTAAGTSTDPSVPAASGSTWNASGTHYRISADSGTIGAFTYATASTSLDVSLVNPNASGSVGSSSAQSLTYKDAVETGVDLELKTTSGYAQKDIVLTQLPASVKIGSASTYDVTFKLAPKDQKTLDIQIGSSTLSQQGTIVSSAMATILANGVPVSYIWSATAHDAENPAAPTQHMALTLWYEQRADGIYITKQIPTAWLKQAVFPVRADLLFSTTVGGGDGDVGAQPYPSSWATMHADTAGTGGANYVSQTVYPHAGAYVSSTGYISIARAFFPLDTSAIPDNATISSSTFKFYVTAKSDDFNDAYDYMTLYQGSQASTSQVVDSDISKCGDAITNPTKGSSDLDITNATTSAWNTLPLNATGLGWISKTGFTKLCMREGHDATNHETVNNSGTWALSGLTISSSESSVVSQAPYLEVTYTVPNTVPGQPTNLLVEGQSNPVGLLDQTPYFSAQFNDADVGDYATAYQIQVATTSDWSSPVWDSSKTTLASTTFAGAQTGNITYGGTPLALDGRTYFWRMRMWDGSNATSTWLTSTTTYFKMADNGNLLQDLNYTYDAVGNITQISDLATVDVPKTITYAYDNLYRMTAATSTATSSQNIYARTYKYDPLGNITSASDQGAYSYTGNTGSNYANPDAVTAIATSSATTTLAYDNNGNLTTYGKWNFTWDYRNQLTQVATGTATSTYTYDYAGARAKAVEGATITVTANQYYSTATAGSNATTTDQIFAGNLLLATREKSATASTTRYVHTDNLTGSNVITDATGVASEYLDYYPYGAPRLDSTFGGYKGEKRKFIGQEYDTPTGLSYLNARYYNGARGGFVSEDPVFIGVPSKQTITDPQSLNSYSYSDDNPINRSDPSGLQSVNAAAQAQQTAIQNQINSIQQQINQLWQNVTINAPKAAASGAMNPVTAYNIAKNPSNPISVRAGAGIGFVGGIVGTLFAPEARGVDSAVELLNPGIKITESALLHVSERHTVDGVKNAGASVFNAGENVASLIQQGTQQAIQSQKGGNFQRVFNVGRDIGIDRNTGAQSSVMTIITNAAHNLVTAFPGRPTF